MYGYLVNVLRSWLIVKFDIFVVEVKRVLGDEVNIIIKRLMLFRDCIGY